MKTSVKALLAIAALALFSEAQAFVPPSPVLSNVTLDPTLNQLGFNSEGVCDGAGFLSCGAGDIASGPSDTYTVTFTNAGLFSASISGSIVDTAGTAFFSPLVFSLLDPSASVVALLTTSISNVPVVAGVYTVIVTYLFHHSDTASSANWSMPLTSGAIVIKTPEPATLALLAIGLLGIGVLRRKQG